MNEGFLDPRTIVDGEFLVESSSSRNRCFKVLRGLAPGLFVKQARTFEPAHQDTLVVEATCYWLANNDARYSRMKTFLPTYYSFDVESYVLTVGLCDRAEDLNRYHLRTGDFSSQIARQLGEYIAAVHRCLEGDLSAEPSVRLLPHGIPWIFQIADKDVGWLRLRNAADGELVELVRSSSEYASLIAQAKRDWRASSLIHGDLKWANVLVEHGSSTVDPPALKLIDWELAAIGDPCWDVAGVFQSYLSHWVLTAGGDGRVIDAMRPSSAAFWQSYVVSMNSDDAQRRSSLNKSLRQTGVRIVQTCFELSRDQAHFPERGAQLLQLGLNILKSPEDVGGELLGVE